MGELFVRGDARAEPDDFRALPWEGAVSQRVGLAGARIGGSGRASGGITLVEKPRTIELRGAIGAVREDGLRADERRDGEEDRRQCKQTGTPQQAWPPGDKESLAQTRPSGKQAGVATV